MGAELHFISNITKVYPDMIKILIYKEPQVFIRSGSIKRKREQIIDDNYTPDITSLNRTKNLIRDYVLANKFDLFCTFTFDPKKVNRYSYSACCGKMSRWLHHQKEKDVDLAYLIVPEQHKDGAWHFHALISHFKGSLKPSGLKTKTGRDIYNITCFRSGFSTAVPIDDREAVSNYVTKYITKDFIKSFNQRRFFSSRNLIKPQKVTNSDIFRRTLPIFRRKVSEHDEFSIYEIQNIF